MGLREKIAYLIYRFDNTEPREGRDRDKYLSLTDAILLILLATPDNDIAAAISEAIPAAAEPPKP
jgi:hypothetical protein